MMHDCTRRFHLDQAAENPEIIIVDKQSYCLNLVHNKTWFLKKCGEITTSQKPQIVMVLLHRVSVDRGVQHKLTAVRPKRVDARLVVANTKKCGPHVLDRGFS